MILVSGATGNNGMELVRQLREMGAPVRALVRKNDDKAETLRQQGAEIAIGDLGDPASLDKALAGVDQVFVLSSFDPRQVEWQGNLVEAARRAGVARLVKLSVLGADPNHPVARMLRWHGETEKQIEASGLSWTHLRPNSYFQNAFWFAGVSATGGSIYAPMGDLELSAVDTRDIASVAARVLTETGHEGKIYEITGPETLSHYDFASVISGVSGNTVTYVPVSFEDAKNSMMAMGQPEWSAAGLVELYQSYQTGYGAVITDTVFRVGKRQPRTFKEFVDEYAAVFKAAAH